MIAKYPSEKRDESHLMLINKKTGSIKIEPHFKNIKNYLQKGDTLVYNNTKVSKRRFYLTSSKGRIHECIFLEKNDTKDDSETWKCILAKSGKLKCGERLFHNKDSFVFIGLENSNAIIQSEFVLTEEFFEKNGNIPIPPYLKRKAEDSDNSRYQTIFADLSGSVAAPTAALHFTDELKAQLLDFGVEFIGANLTIGYGTFAKVTEEQIQNKKLHSERYTLSPGVAENLNSQKQNKHRIISIGTTTLRVLETCYDSQNAVFVPGSSSTELFITPEDSVCSIDALVTNFHLPGSSLIMLVAAFAGTELLMEAYHKAIENKMRFYSYGDAMLIF